MARINLLPWREELRERKKKLFIVIWGGVVGSAAIIIFIADMIVSSGAEIQEQRNRMLNSEIAKLDSRITEIKGIKIKKQRLLERMTVIEGLQGNRPVIVRVFDELTRVVPEGVYFRTLIAQEKTFNLVGVAESNNRVSALMRNLDSSLWFINPNLTAVRKVSEKGESLNEFDLTFGQTTPGSESDG